jgi:hypothetical protein
VTGEDAAAVFVAFAEPGSVEAGPFEAELKAADAGEEATVPPAP